MNRTAFPHVIRFVGLVLFQILILDQLNLHGFLNPYIYPLFLLMLPLQMAPWIVLLLGFFLGISVDLFTNSMGMHTAASVLLAYLRPYALNLIIPSGGYEVDDKPTVTSLGFTWFFSYALALIFLHHLFFFYLEMFRFSHFFATLFKVFLSTIFSVSLIMLSQFVWTAKR